jgi:hypothetical protein
MISFEGLIQNGLWSRVNVVKIMYVEMNINNASKTKRGHIFT